jgi:long-chain acyl-CoA synthetase
MSPDGFFTVLERKHDLIKVSGFSVYPSEVEEVLLQHPVIDDCAVIALPDRHTGERVAACVVVPPAYPFSADELSRHCDKHLTPYKVPHQFILVEAIPRSIIGKLQRADLRRHHTPGQEAHHRP